LIEAQEKIRLLDQEIISKNNQIQYIKIEAESKIKSLEQQLSAKMQEVTDLRQTLAQKDVMLARQDSSASRGSSKLEPRQR
jgi:hypothetical protein